MRMIYKVKSHIDINDGLYKYNFDNDYRYYEFIKHDTIETPITVDDLCELDKYHFKKRKRLFSKKEYLEITLFADSFEINIEDIKSIKYVTEYEPCFSVTIDFLAKNMYHDEFLDYVSDKLKVSRL